jgi:GNAT superfamily N-acetyltransferase
MASVTTARYDGAVPDLELLRVTDISALERWWGIHDAAMTADHVALPADPIAELVPSLSGSEAGYAVELWLARSAGADVGCARLSRPLHDNVTLADLELTVSPGCRGRGHGTRLAEAMLSRVRELGATTVTAEICRPLGAESGDSPAARIATRQGARPALAELRRLLDLMAGEPDGLAELEAEAAGHAAGYTMVSWADRAAEDDVADLADLMGRMSTDAPSGELTREPEVWDAARYREKEDSTLAKGRRRLSVAARENATGRWSGSPTSA